MAFVQKNRTAHSFLLFCFWVFKSTFLFSSSPDNTGSQEEAGVWAVSMRPNPSPPFHCKVVMFSPQTPSYVPAPPSFHPLLFHCITPPPPHLLQVSNRCQRWTTSLWGSLYKSVTDVMLHNCGPRYDVMVAFVSCQIHVKSVTVTCC